MASALLIDVDYLQEHSVVPTNVDPKLIEPSIVWVGDYYIQKILGTDLYEQICTQISSSTLSSANQTLLNTWLKDCLINYIISELPDDFKLRLMNKGPMIKNSENSQPASIEDIERFISKYKSKAEFYAQRAINFLCDNTSTYPLYSGGNSNLSDIQPISNSFKCSLFLGDADSYVDKVRDYKNITDL
jgi:hypothetical protein